MKKYLTEDTVKIFKEYFEKKSSKLKSGLEEAIEIPAGAIEDIGREIDSLVQDNEKEVSWLTTLDEQHQEFETNLIELDSNVHNMRLFTFFSFVLNVIFFIVMVLGGLF